MKEARDAKPAGDKRRRPSTMNSPKVLSKDKAQKKKEA